MAATIPRVTKPAMGILRAAALRPVACGGRRFFSATIPRAGIAVTGKPVDDIDVAFDYPSDAQGAYPHADSARPGMPSMAARLDKEKGWPDNSMLYLAVLTMGIGALYMSLKSISNPAEISSSSRERQADPGTDARRSTSYQHHDHPAHKPNNAPMEKWIGRGG
ncbi:hypothetical protein B0H63DRAFT_451071 [Podospora didyma]|uniref:Uncharacterized protein n=1 Tax=Podospora didyma TaxID=330526 RepID=A0AAE0NHV0_9PEZI|nr:hypothetical protein B0H63DRAFT_451071 [Podospora didyma]